MIKIEFKNEPLFGNNKTEIYGLTNLTGTEKQIKWAEDIRKNVIIYSYWNFKEFIANVKKFYKVDNTDKRIKKMEDDFFDELEKRYSNPSAKWWIDNRDIKPININYFNNDNWKNLFKK